MSIHRDSTTPRGIPPPKRNIKEDRGHPESMKPTPCRLQTFDNPKSWSELKTVSFENNTSVVNSRVMTTLSIASDLNNKDAALEAVKSNSFSLHHLSSALQAEKNIALAAIQQRGSLLALVHPGMRQDREVVIEAVKRDGRSLKFASEFLRGDYEVVLTAVRRDGIALEFAAERLRNDEMVSALITLAFAHKTSHFVFPLSHQPGPESRVMWLQVAMAAVTENWRALEFVSSRLKRHQGIVAAAVRVNWRAMRLASPEFQGPTSFEGKRHFL
jgi:hypothetical protein